MLGCSLIVSWLLDAIVVFYVLFGLYAVLVASHALVGGVSMLLCHFLVISNALYFVITRQVHGKQEIAVLHAFAPNSHQNGKLLSQTSCKEVCRSVEMIYSVCMLSPDMGGPRYGLILLL